jgi:hypothetical protein
VTRWVVRGYYLEDWPEPGDESEGVVALVIADTEEEARAEYERHYQNCSSVLLDAEDDWNEHRRRDAATAEHFGKVHVAPSGRVQPAAARGEEHVAPAANVRNTAGCCDGDGQVHHGEGALSYVTLCRNRECLERGVAAWTDPQHETPASGEKR